LLARPPGPLPALAEGKKTIPLAELGVIVDLPADLLRRRPDVRAVEMQLAAQSSQIGVAEAAFYPSIALLGSLGLSASSLAGSPSTLAYGIGPNLVWNVFDHGQLTGQVLVQDARFQQLYEQYQAAILTAAREVDDAAVGFGTNRAQIPILKDAVKAAQRSLGIANIQYQDGISDFQRVLDAQRTLFSQQEVLVSTISNATLSLIALYKAMGGGWQQGRGRPLVDAATGETMGEPGDWQEILAAPLPPPAAGPQLIRKN
jgi:outer membrane protein TolC